MSNVFYLEQREESKFIIGENHGDLCARLYRKNKIVVRGIFQFKGHILCSHLDLNVFRLSTDKKNCMGLYKNYFYVMELWK